MTILSIGDEHTYGFGLPTRQLSYIGHFVRQLSRSGRAVTVDAYVHRTLRESTDLLARLPLAQYDLIVLQPALEWHRPRTSNGLVSLAGNFAWSALLPSAGDVPGATCPQKRSAAGRATHALLNVAASVIPAAGCPAELMRLLTLLRPYRHSTLLMTPFPGRVQPEQWLRKRGRLVLLKQGARQAFSVFDIQTVIQPRDEYFLTGDDKHLNAVSHELVGRSLFDFYQSAPTIITVQMIWPGK